MGGQALAQRRRETLFAQVRQRLVREAIDIMF
jgi:hypothetical protein